MKIIVAKNVGFCFGVKRAIEIAEKSLKEDPVPIQFLGELINNEVVIKSIKRKGGKFVSNQKQIGPGTLVIRAHGVPPFSPLKTVLIRDATCPLVKRAQEAAKSLLKDGYTVIIIGDKNHPEIKGIQGYVNNQAIIIEKGTDVQKLKNFKKIGIIAQTTQNLDNINRILKILRKRAKTVKWINTLCPEVFSRQRELRRILRKAEGILVIGSRSSANTRRLAEIAKKAKKPVWRVNSLKELKKQKFHNMNYLAAERRGIPAGKFFRQMHPRRRAARYLCSEINCLGIVSGTSTPDWEVEKIKRYLINKNKCVEQLFIRVNPRCNLRKSASKNIVEAERRG